MRRNGEEEERRRGGTELGAEGLRSSSRLARSFSSDKVRTNQSGSSSSSSSLPRERTADYRNHFYSAKCSD